MVSAVFGLMCQNDIIIKNKYQKRLFDKTFQEAMFTVKTKKSKQPRGQSDGPI